MLIIDEVDTFFDPQFYGNIYQPICNVKDKCVLDLVQYIWKNRASKLNLSTIKGTTEYQACIKTFTKNWEKLLDENVKDMLCDL